MASRTSIVSDILPERVFVAGGFLGDVDGVGLVGLDGSFVSLVCFFFFLGVFSSAFNVWVVVEFMVFFLLAPERSTGSCLMVVLSNGFNFTRSTEMKIKTTRCLVLSFGYHIIK